MPLCVKDSMRIFKDNRENATKSEQGNATNCVYTIKFTVLTEVHRTEHNKVLNKILFFIFKFDSTFFSFLQEISHKNCFSKVSFAQLKIPQTSNSTN